MSTVEKAGSETKRAGGESVVTVLRIDGNRVTRHFRLPGDSSDGDSQRMWREADKRCGEDDQSGRME